MATTEFADKLAACNKHESTILHKRWKNKHNRRWIRGPFAYGGYDCLSDPGSSSWRKFMHKYKVKEIRKYHHEQISLYDDMDFVWNGSDAVHYGDWSSSEGCASDGNSCDIEVTRKEQPSFESECNIEDSWRCANCHYTNRSIYAFCRVCNFCKEQATDNEPHKDHRITYQYKYGAAKPLKRKSRTKRKRMRRSQKRSRTEFQQYWNDMKRHQHALQKLAVEYHANPAFRRKKYTKWRKPLNFKIVITCNPRQKIQSYVKDMLHRKTLPLPHVKPIKLYLLHDAEGDADNYYKIGYHVSFITQNSTARTVFRYDAKTRVYGYFNEYQKLFDEQDAKMKQIVAKWMSTVDMTEYIKQKIKLHPEFMYMGDCNMNDLYMQQYYKRVNREDAARKTMDIGVTIKLESFAGTEYNYIKEKVKVNENMCFENIPFKLTNYTVTECAVQMTDAKQEWSRSYKLIPKGMVEEMYIAMDVPQNEFVSKAINAAKYENPENVAKVKKFTAECVERLVGRSSYQRSLQEWIYFEYDECHNPNCNLLPLTCDLDRVLNDHLPYYDVLKEVLLSYVGYRVLHYVKLHANNVEYEYVEDSWTSMEVDDSIRCFFSSEHGARKGFHLYAQPDTVIDHKVEPVVVDKQKQRKPRAWWDTESSESSSSVYVNLFSDGED